MSDKFYWTEKEERQFTRSEWIAKNGWIIQTIVSSIALIIAITNAIS